MPSIGEKVYKVNRLKTYLVQHIGIRFGISVSGSARIGPSFGPVQAKMAYNACMGP